MGVNMARINHQYSLTISLINTDQTEAPTRTTLMPTLDQLAKGLALNLNIVSRELDGNYCHLKLFDDLGRVTNGDPKAPTDIKARIDGCVNQKQQ
jgi:hypothetical protein